MVHTKKNNVIKLDDDNEKQIDDELVDLQKQFDLYIKWRDDLIANLQIRNQELQEANYEANNLLLSKLQENAILNQFQKYFQNLKEENIKLNQANNDLTTKNILLQQNIKQSKDNNALQVANNNQYEKVKNQNEQLKSDNGKLKDKLAALKNSHQDLKQINEELTREIASANINSNSLQRQNETLKKQINGYNLAKLKYQKSITDYKQELTNTQMNLTL